MDNIMREGEQALEGQSGGGGGNNNNNMNSGNDQGNMGGGNDNSQGGGNMGGGNMNQQSGGNQSGGGGFMGGLEKTGEDSMMNQEINQFASKEGVPAAADGEIDSLVDKEV